MPDPRALIQTAERRGLRLFLAEGKVKVEAPEELDSETAALIEALRQHREEIRSVLAQERPPPCWNCGGVTTETKDIYGQTVCVCWSCATWA